MGANCLTRQNCNQAMYEPWPRAGRGGGGGGGALQVFVNDVKLLGPLKKWYLGNALVIKSPRVQSMQPLQKLTTLAFVRYPP